MKKYITMEPQKVQFLDDEKKPIEEERGGIMTWEDFLHKVEDHPKWPTKYRLGRMMDDIWTAYEEAVERGDWIMVIEDDETYKEFEQVCQEPKYTVMIPGQGPKEIPGWGVHNRLNRQMLCFPKAVINAVDEDPRKKEEPIEEKAEKVAEEKAEKAKADESGEEKAA